MSASSPLPAPHPAALPLDELRKQCDINRLRRSGPGGQHRNKVETAALYTHRPTGISAEANERRSQAQNAEEAIHRLRVRLAVEVRTPPEEAPSALWKRRAAGGSMRVNPAHEDFPSLLAEALNWLAAHDWDDKATAEQLGVSRTNLLRLLRSEAEALARLNEARRERGLGPLR